MALPDALQLAQQSALVWGQPTAGGVTHGLTMNGLASAAGRMGDAADLGATFEQDYSVFLVVETGTAPAAGATVELYLAFSHDNSTWPGKVTGSDAAYPATIEANKKQLGMPVALLIATADANTVLRQAPSIIRPPARYVVPVVVNLLGQAFRTEGTATDNDSRVILVPVRSIVSD